MLALFGWFLSEQPGKPLWIVADFVRFDDVSSSESSETTIRHSTIIGSSEWCLRSDAQLCCPVLFNYFPGDDHQSIVLDLPRLFGHTSDIGRKYFIDVFVDCFASSCCSQVFFWTDLMQEKNTVCRGTRRFSSVNSSAVVRLIWMSDWNRHEWLSLIQSQRDRIGVSKFWIPRRECSQSWAW